MEKVFYDAEFTGLTQDTDLISICFSTRDRSKHFYAEFSDYDEDKVDVWVQEHVIDNLKFNDVEDFKTISTDFYKLQLKDTKHNIVKYLTMWLEVNFPDKFRLYADMCQYDIVLFNQMFGGGLDILENQYYIPFDVCTLFECKGVDPDISRDDFSELELTGKQHNCEWDVDVLIACYNKLENLPFKMWGEK